MAWRNIVRAFSTIVLILLSAIPFCQWAFTPQYDGLLEGFERLLKINAGKNVIVRMRAF